MLADSPPKERERERERVLTGTAAVRAVLETGGSGGCAVGGGGGWGVGRQGVPILSTSGAVRARNALFDRSSGRRLSTAQTGHWGPDGGICNPGAALVTREMSAIAGRRPGVSDAGHPARAPRHLLVPDSWLQSPVSRVIQKFIGR